MKIEQSLHVEHEMDEENSAILENETKVVSLKAEAPIEYNTNEYKDEKETATKGNTLIILMHGLKGWDCLAHFNILIFKVF